MEQVAGYRKLLVWQKADQLVLLVYTLTAQFPKHEIFSLTSQLRRAALSIATNIVEGYARNSSNEFHRFLSISLGSLAETKYLLSVGERLGYIKKDAFGDATNIADEVGRLLWSLYRQQEKKDLVSGAQQ